MTTKPHYLFPRFVAQDFLNNFAPDGLAEFLIWTEPEAKNWKYQNRKNRKNRFLAKNLRRKMLYEVVMGREKSNDAKHHHLSPTFKIRKNF